MAIVGVGAALVAGAVFGGVSLADSANDDLSHGFPSHQATASPSAEVLTETLTADQRKRLGTRAAVSADGSVSVYAPARDGDMVTFPVTLTNPSDAARVVTAHIWIHASPHGQPVDLHQGAVDSGGLVAPDATLLTEISVQGAHSIRLEDLAVEIRQAAQEPA
ncbi:hypothetical protein ACFW40_34960 [Streptomyces sp. NPDC058807]|uniref:hypothetical protein n=1 Tax=unclassified Streptomyces TaxID=2593676 RepID=UPI0036CE4271